MVCLLFGCSDKKRKGNFYLPAVSESNLKWNDLHVERIVLDSVPSSYVIESGLFDRHVYVVDRNLCLLYNFDLSGKFVKKALGTGHAKNETVLSQIQTHAFLENGDLFLFGSSGDHYLYDKDIQLKDFMMIYYERDKNQRNDDLYDDPLYYTHEYGDMVCRPYRNSVYFNVHLGISGFNYVDATERYLQSAANIMETRLDKHELGRLLAVGYPESYFSQSSKKAMFAAVKFDISHNGEFYVTYEADSLIYKYDNDYTELQCFGFSGKDMNLDYRNINSRKELGKYWREDSRTKGYYNWLEYVDETGMLFRSYQKGGDEETDGLQIYKEGVLLGDVNVPKGFRVMGYIAPYYYSYVIPDEDNAMMYLYRFVLPVYEKRFVYIRNKTDWNDKPW